MHQQETDNKIDETSTNGHIAEWGGAYDTPYLLTSRESTKRGALEGQSTDAPIGSTDEWVYGRVRQWDQYEIIYFNISL